MGLKIAEAFKDRCFLTVLATGAPATLLADVTCVEIDQLGNRAPLVVAEESDGWYTTSFTPDAAGTWATEWSKTLVPENYVFHYPYKEFKVAGGQEDDIYTRVGAPAGASVSADIAAIKAETALIVADTGELQTDWVNGGRLDLLIDAIKARTDHHEITKAFFSSPAHAEADLVTIPAVAADQVLPSVTLPNITGTITHVYAGFKYRKLENNNVGANKLAGAQDIQVRVDTPGAWADAINFGDDTFRVAASTLDPGDCIMFTAIDLVGTVTTFNDIYEFQWDEAVADLASLLFYDVQTFLIVSYY